MTTTKEALNQISGGRVLDVATGSGQFIPFLIENLKDNDEIIGIDTSEKAAKAFDKDFHDNPRVHYQHMDAAHMDFPDSSFDTVCISNSLHHMPDPAAVLREMRRVLRPGGTCMVSEMYCDGQTETQLTHVAMHHWSASIDRAKGVYHAPTYTRQQLLDIVAGMALQDMQVFDDDELDQDPRDPETSQFLHDAIARNLEGIQGLPQEEALRQAGEDVRRRVEAVGFHSATTLLIIGRA